MNDAIDDFITRWKPSGGNEIANFQSFAVELTQLLSLEAPKPATSDGQNNDYRFERPVDLSHTGKERRGRIDLYRKGCFVLEAKQGGDRAKPQDKNQLSLLTDQDAPKAQAGHGPRGSAKWDDTMLQARNQADRYARGVAKQDGWPPFLIIVDVGHVFEFYADFSRQGQGYTQFPDGNRYRMKLEDLRNPEKRAFLQTIWNDPYSLDPALVTARVTREIAGHLAELGKSFEGQGHASADVANFLMRCLFTMFAEDVELIPKDSFTNKLRELRGHPEHAEPTLKALWQTMDTGGFSPVLLTDLKRFNGGLFANATALPLNALQLGLLINAAEQNWREVEPAIFGTLLERALNKRERHKLGAHYTPRAYVERLVIPTVIEPLRADWRVVQVAAQRLATDGKLTEARDTVHAFHRRLTEVRVLDPACGSGNFLYVALELMKRLEGEVTALLSELGEDQTALGLEGHTVDPHQFLGIELNPWAAAVAELVLWIGYLQWHFRTHGKASPSEPVLRDFHNVENRDAVLEWDSRSPRMENGAPVTRWDGVTTILHNVTGEAVPDPTARIPLYDYAKPRPAKWPDAEFIVGNPPFIGASRLRDSLGDGYTQALWKAYPKMPQSADLVMFWWEKAALAARAWKPATEKARAKGTRRFGFITTNSLRQTFNRKVLEPHLADPKTPLSLVFAVPDHPWVDAGDGAAVRIAMTVAERGNAPGRLGTVTEERKGEKEAEGRPVTLSLEKGRIFADLRIGADVAGAKALKANEGLATRGVMLFGAGFIVTPEQAETLGFGTNRKVSSVIKPYRNGRDLLGTPRGVLVIDLWGYQEEELRLQLPSVYQFIRDTVWPERSQNNRESRRKKWWLFGEALGPFRPALEHISRYIVTVETAKHRTFQFLNCEILPDNKLVALALKGAETLAVLSAKQHVIWSLEAGSWLGIGNDPVYAKTKCFDPFPFPTPTPEQTEKLRALGEQLDAHRKVQQAAHPKLTLTNMYNVLEKLRAGEKIVGKDKEIYDQGLIGILRDLHDRIDTAVAEAYGWPADLSDDDILHRLVALNRERAEEEAQGIIRWLRPEYQNPKGTQIAQGKQSELDVGTTEKVEKAPWPKTLPEQISAVQAALRDMGEATPDQIARRFARARASSVQPLLESLAALGQAEATSGGRYAM
jgi:hypothetical protein